MKCGTHFIHTHADIPTVNDWISKAFKSTGSKDFFMIKQINTWKDNRELDGETQKPVEGNTVYNGRGSI